MGDFLWNESGGGSGDGWSESGGGVGGGWNESGGGGGWNESDGGGGWNESDGGGGGWNESDGGGGGWNESVGGGGGWNETGGGGDWNEQISGGGDWNEQPSGGGESIVQEEVDCHSDEFLLSLLSNEIQDDQINVITEGLQLQKALLSSCMMLVDSDAVNSVIDEKKFHGISPPGGDEPPPEEDEMDWNQNNPINCICELCTVVKKRDNQSIVRVQDCGHYLCEFCLNKYISEKVDNGDRSIKCPIEKCNNLIQYDYCVATMLKYVLDKRGQLFSESLIVDPKSIPCPYKDCESGILKENLQGWTEIECLECRRFVCVKCYAPLHGDVDCEEFQRKSIGERGWKDLLIMEEIGGRVKTVD